VKWAISVHNGPMKLIIGLAFIAIVGSLAAAGFFMLRRGEGASPDQPSRMAHALAWRIGLSVLLFVCLLVLYALGWIQPTGIVVGT